MERRILTLRYGKWLGILLACIMFAGTAGAFPLSVSAAISAVFGAGFWILVKREEVRQIGRDLAVSIKEAVEESWSGEHFIEIKRIRRGMIARIYLIGPRERMENVQRAVGARLQENVFRDYLWVMQMTSMKSREDLKTARKILNRQLIHSLVEQGEKDGQQEHAEDGR
jgi:hypothetical protein